MSESKETKDEDNSVEQIISDLHGREMQRRRAIDLAFAQVSGAANDAETMAGLENLARMMGVYDEFTGQFPEIFPPNET